jgi:EpsI family protein
MDRKKEFLVSLILILLLGSFATLIRYSEVTPKNLPKLSELPYEHNGWMGRDYYLDKETFQVLKANQVLLRQYKKGEKEIWLFVGYFKDQKYGSQIHSPKNCLPGGGWNILAKKKTAVTLSQAKNFKADINEFLISDKRSTELMLYWFQTRSGVIRSEFNLKGDLVLNALKRRPTDAAFIRLTSPIHNNDYGKVLQDNREFLNDFGDLIQKSLPF